LGRSWTPARKKERDRGTTPVPANTKKATLKGSRYENQKNRAGTGACPYEKFPHLNKWRGERFNLLFDIRYPTFVIISC